MTGAPSGLTGTVGVRVLDNTGATVTPRQTAGISEFPAGSGFYTVTLPAPDTMGQYTVLWDSGVVGPETTAAEDLVVTTSRITVVPGPPSGTTFGDALAMLRGAEGYGFGISEGQAAKFLNEGIRRFASRSQWIRAEIDLGQTVAGVERYTVPPNVVDLRTVKVGEMPFARTDIESLWAFQSGDDQLPPDVNGVFVKRFTDDGATRTIGFYPIPDTSGLAILGIGSIWPAAELAGDDSLPFPEDHWQGALWAAVAIAYERIDENTPQADIYWARFRDDAEELRRLAISRIGSGPTKIGGPWRR